MLQLETAKKVCNKISLSVDSNDYKLSFIVTVAVLGAAEVTVNQSEEGSPRVSSTESPLMTLLKAEVKCLNSQLKVCEQLLATVEDCKKGMLMTDQQFACQNHLSPHSLHAISFSLCIQRL